MGILVFLVLAAFIYAPWLGVSLWLSRRIRPPRTGASRVLAVLLRIAVFVVLAMVLPSFAGLLLYFWAYVVAGAPWFAAIAYIVAIVPALWFTRRLELPLSDRTLTAAQALAFLGFVFWLPPVVVLIPAIIVEGA